MKSVLVLGAGMVSRPLVDYLLAFPDIHMTVASRTRSKADVLVGGHPHGQTRAWTVDDRQGLSELIRNHHITISLLPAPLHPMVAQLCIEHGKPMVTTSYVGPEMRALDGPARRAGVLLLNEIGVDPGIDHMSAMRVIDQVRARGGQVQGFKSYCGGLPAPQHNDNPLGYKMSWSAQAVCRAATNSARFLRDGQDVRVAGTDLASAVESLDFEGIGQLEAYPNRDSLVYLDVYGLRGVGTMFRGTLRYPGWCETVKALHALGLLNEAAVPCAAGTTRAAFTVGRSSREVSAARLHAAEKLGLDAGSPVLERLEWLGLFGDEVLSTEDTQIVPLELLSALMMERMGYAENESDMIILHHEFRAAFPGEPDEHITSTLIAYGRPDGDSAMARTVSLPAAIATRMILEGKLTFSGVHIPVMASVYEPALEELAALDICCVERSQMLSP